MGRSKGIILRPRAAAPPLVNVMRRGRADVAVAEVLAGRLDAEGGRDQRPAFLAQGVDRPAMHMLEHFLVR